MEIRVAGVADASAVGKVHSEAWKSVYRFYQEFRKTGMHLFVVP